jgi:hypothetical protein
MQVGLMGFGNTNTSPKSFLIAVFMAAASRVDMKLN